MVNIISAESLLEGIRIKQHENTDSSFSILVAGDFAPVNRTEEYILSGKEKELLDPEILNKITSADLAIVNLECPLTVADKPIIKQGPTLKADPGNITFLQNAKFHVASLANNHTMDMGQKGLFDTIDQCNKAEILTVGAGRNHKEASKPLFVEINGIYVSIIAIAENEFSTTTTNSPGVAPLDPILNYNSIKQARKDAHIVLVLLHGGNEYYHYPRPGLLKTCRFFIDAGANAVVCSHSHVVSGVEVYNEAPIVYGTGNFLFDSVNPPTYDWHYGYLVRIDFSNDEVNSFSIIPYCQSSDVPGVHLLDENKQNQILNDITSYSKVISDESELLLKWHSFCQSKTANVYNNFIYPYRFRGMKKLMRLFPKVASTFANEKRIVKILNEIRCESHRERNINILENELGIQSNKENGMMKDEKN